MVGGRVRVAGARVRVWVRVKGRFSCRGRDRVRVGIRGMLRNTVRVAGKVRAGVRVKLRLRTRVRVRFPVRVGQSPQLGQGFASCRGESWLE